jgi:hypothetical protein
LTTSGWLIDHLAIIGAAGAILCAMPRFNEVTSVVVRCDYVANIVVNATIKRKSRKTYNVTGCRS